MAVFNLTDTAYENILNGLSHVYNEGADSPAVRAMLRELGVPFRINYATPGQAPNHYLLTLQDMVALFAGLANITRFKEKPMSFKRARARSWATQTLIHHNVPYLPGTPLYVTAF